MVKLSLTKLEHNIVEMAKNTLVFVVAALLIIAGGGIFLWNENQKDVRELNKNLPEGIKVTKSLFGNEYRVVNKIDGYEFSMPIASEEWEGLGLEYYDLTTDQEFGYRTQFNQALQDSIISERALDVSENRSEGLSDNIEIREYALKSSYKLEEFIEELKNFFVSKLQSERRKVPTTIEKVQAGELDILKFSVAYQYLGEPERPFISFFAFESKSKIFLMRLPSIVEGKEEFIKSVIANGIW